MARSFTPLDRIRGAVGRPPYAHPLPNAVMMRIKATRPLRRKVRPSAPTRCRHGRAPGRRVCQPLEPFMPENPRSGETAAGGDEASPGRTVGRRWVVSPVRFLWFVDRKSVV